MVPTINQVQTQQSLWQNAFVGAYFSAVTLTTVGYGDVTPTTGGGRLLAVCIQLAGNLLLALPVGVIGANFVDLYALHESQPPEVCACASIV